MFQALKVQKLLPSVLWHCWLGGRKGIQPVKKCRDGGGGHWLLVSLDGVAPSRIVGVSASVNLPLHHKVQKFSYGTGKCLRSLLTDLTRPQSPSLLVVFADAYTW